MNEYYVNFLDGKRLTIQATDKNQAADKACEKNTRHYGDIISVFPVASFPEINPCIYCGEPTSDLICSDKCQREHFGM